jgi:mono/diheme cytochrome c family protein
MSFCALFLLIFLGCLGGCKRSSREYGGARPRTAPQWTTKEQLTSIAQPAVIRELLAADLPQSGEALFLKNCAACHQTSGQGVPGAFPPLAASHYVTGDNTERMASIMLYGLVGPIRVNNAMFAGAMTPFGAVLSDEELAAIATYARSAWGNNAAAVRAEVFKRVREKWGSRPPFQISELGEEP